ncbi:uncharacterized protein N7479_010746 [Penicillium vulpinum]|uniref:Uncharacterized protein n=1 Tax=Penicillium vulpinum TaxID=29845 RepID=A0A1V6S8Q3_9EURO|nr:uncharacterized protein N7479_010746 [Penicillium vulpinum]KAJ5952333.1 hypothetical protein N7479_010746 [Penicillium vulpinum]OQE10246.1 hypothetical protein PENVUL_c004G04869 [Penicillium vulpinum]
MDGWKTESGESGSIQPAPKDGSWCKKAVKAFQRTDRHIGRLARFKRSPLRRRAPAARSIYTTETRKQIIICSQANSRQDDPALSQVALCHSFTWATQLIEWEDLIHKPLCPPQNAIPTTLTPGPIHSSFRSITRFQRAKIASHFQYKLRLASIEPSTFTCCEKGLPLGD